MLSLQQQMQEVGGKRKWKKKCNDERERNWERDKRMENCIASPVVIKDPDHSLVRAKSHKTTMQCQIWPSDH